MENVPVFDFKCTECGEREEHILLEREDPPERCPACGGPLKRVYGGARLQISFESWGFNRTDSLIADTRGKDFKAIKERAQRIVEE